MGRSLRESTCQAVCQRFARQRQGAFGFTMDARAERFLLVVPAVRTSDTSDAPLTVIANWPSLLKKAEK